MSIKTRVIELEPDWLLVAFSGEKPPAAERAFWLDKTLSDWLGSHPGRFVGRTLPVLQGDELFAVHIWLDITRAELEKRLQIQVRDSVLTAMPKEHLEALLQFAYDVFFQRPNEPLLAVVNRRGVAVVIDRTSERLHILPAKEMTADERTHRAVQAWLAAPDSAHFVIQFATAENKIVRGI